MSNSSQFVHLHAHTEFSLLDGAIRLKQLVDHTAEQGGKSVALTDNGVMFGAIDFYQYAKSKGIQPIIGCEMYLTDDITVKKRGFDRIILLCKNYAGYQNLSQLVTISHVDGFYYKPRIDLETLAKYKDDLICISPGMRGPVAFRIQGNHMDEAKAQAKAFQEVFGENFYLGVQRLGMPFEDAINETTKAYSEELGIQVVATGDAYYLRPDDAVLRSILNCIQMGRVLDGDQKSQLEDQAQYLMPAQEMAARFKDWPEAIANSARIADACKIEIEMDRVQLPKFDCPDGLSSEAYLEKLVWEGINRLYSEITDEIKERVAFELGIIEKMGYPVYFLIIYDFLDYCFKQNIPVGPGRGSAAGSIVSYALNITRIDPMEYNLLFERFLNPERVSMPDVDLDFCIKRRGEVIEYLTEHYGSAHVAQISTFGTMASRAVLRDVGRVLDIPLNEVDKIAKLIPAVPGQPTSLSEAEETVKELAKLLGSNSIYRRLFDYGKRLEGFARHNSTHAAGVVISYEPLSSVVPLLMNDGNSATQYTMNALENIGLLKMDILGLRNLTVLENARVLIHKKTGEWMDLDKLPLDDGPTYALLCKGQTMGVFQCESDGMRQLIKDMRPGTFEDIIALLALYRPGPLGSGMVKDFVSNKLGETTVQYDLPELEPILKDTYGMIVYQEQVMQIASVIGGFSLGQADMLRRAMGKKKKSEMDRLRDEFIEGAKEKEFDVTKAEKIFELCYKFAEYGFNKSHSAAYALISYQTAYLKANYPQEYMTALLSSVLGNTDKTGQYITECRAMELPVLPPDVHESEYDFVISGKGIRFGLGGIKNVGEAPIEAIVAGRKKEGAYETLMDFLMDVDTKSVNKRVLECLIKTGALDRIDPERGRLLTVFEEVLEKAQVKAKELATGQFGLFGGMEADMAKGFHGDIEYTPLGKQEILKLEKEMTGLYISGHPLDGLREQLEASPTNTQTFGEKDDGSQIVLIGLLTGVRRIITKTNREMMVAALEDLNGTMDALFFLNEKNVEMAELFLEDSIVALRGRLRASNDKMSLTVQSVDIISDAFRAKQLHVEIEMLEDFKVLEDIRNACVKHRGDMPVVLHYQDKSILVSKKYWVKQDAERVFSPMVGDGRVWRA
ncbi:DNA polymerase III subunit alpha [bacterium]|nr:DNA polymerase III subunit alpha [bacterium]